jgi:hypothetical protein
MYLDLYPSLVSRYMDGNAALCYAGIRENGAVVVERAVMAGAVQEHGRLRIAWKRKRPSRNNSGGWAWLTGGSGQAEQTALKGMRRGAGGGYWCTFKI